MKSLSGRAKGINPSGRGSGASIRKGGSLGQSNSVNVGGAKSLRNPVGRPRPVVIVGGEEKVSIVC